MNSESNPFDKIPVWQRKQEKKTASINKTIWGLLIGLVAAFVGVLLVYVILYRRFTFDSYIELFLPGKLTYALAAKSISLAMIFNLLPFYFFLNKKYYQATKGVVFATGLVGILFIFYKFVW
ncbi:MAG TPA: hypothetical protein VLZ83_11070 [Edaphocola sp.]|nr:hypothetical protein [Edaphocola sp.]